ncbi:MAG TPA: TIR domain-containing protein [Polyangiaceae bacterium]
MTTCKDCRRAELPQPVRVLVLHGRDNRFRDGLLAWLLRAEHGIDARTVGDMRAHSDGSIDERVSESLAWGDRAVAIVHRDRRSASGAPNVIEEIGRWREAKGKKTLALLWQKGVRPWSNIDGIVRIEFQRNVSEGFPKLERFLGMVQRAVV